MVPELTVSPADALPDDPASERVRAYAFETVAPDRYRVPALPSGLLRLYGGMVVSQALAAARLTVAGDREAHSLHAYFLQPGMTDRPLDFAIARESDGRSFSNRTVRVLQDERPVLNMMVSFKTGESAGEHGLAMPQVPPPESLPALADIMAARAETLAPRHRPFWLRRQQVDWRPVEPFIFEGCEPRAPVRHFWFRFEGEVEDAPHVHRRLLAYASDLHIFHTGLSPLGLGWAHEYLQTSSLDHAIWFHQPFRVDDWLLYALDSPAASNALALGRGNVFRRDGTLVATVSQQGLARIVDRRRDDRL